MRVLFLIAFTLSINVSFSQDAFFITGKVPGMTTGKIYLSEFILKGKRDSVNVENGSFTYRGKVTEPTPYILSLESMFVNKPLLMFFVENQKINIEVNKDDVPKSKVTGSASQKDYEAYLNKTKPFSDVISSLAERRRKVAKDDTKTLDSISKAWEALDAKKREASAEFVKTHPSSAVSAWVITRTFLFIPDLALLESLYNGLHASVLPTSYAKDIKQRLDIEKRFAPGQPALDFSQADTSGKMVSLKDFKGRYVLLDFWASWCGPCRAENPNLVAAYNKFKDKNFTVLGISLDRPDKKDAWIEAIHKDGLTWTHVSDLKFWDNEVAKMYGINAVPANFLVDPSGKIVAKNLSGEQLHEKLGEVLK